MFVIVFIVASVVLPVCLSFDIWVVWYLFALSSSYLLNLKAVASYIHFFTIDAVYCGYNLYWLWYEMITLNLDMTVSCSKVLKDTHQSIFDLYLTVYCNSQRDNLSNAVVHCNKHQITLSKPSTCFKVVPYTSGKI